MNSFKTYAVTLTVRLHVTRTFARESEEELLPIRPSDAVENAIGSLPAAFYEALEYEGIELALPIDGEAVLID